MPDPGSLVGESVAHFKITSKLGQGGMGAVYRAVDTRLGREVALKVLPEDLADDPDRLARLRREAQVLASLNHPNIAAIYGLEEVDGRLILELELVEGEDLSELLSKGLLALDEVVDLARQIASGLDEAHERGIIHRDLKPANLKVTADGVVKILDFGLAKPYAADSAADLVSELATITSDDMTREGVVMGTAAYMSPEQARGRKVDRRSDVWAFGCVLYEMLAGRRAFTGETMTDVLVAVVSGEPDWSAIPRTTPAGVLRVLRRCLRRDPRERLRSLGDAALELAEATEDDAEPVAATAPAQLGTPFALWAFVGPIVGMIVGIGLWWVLSSSEPAARRPVRQLATVSGPVAVYGSFAPSLAVSRDGDRLVYATADPDLLVGQLRDQLDPAPIPGTEGARAPFFAPDGRSVGFWADSSLWKVPVGGGSPVRLCGTSDYFFGAVWSRDGGIYFSRPWVDGGGRTSIALVRVPADGGAVELVAAAEPVDGRTVALAWPRTLPDPGRLLVTRWASGGGAPSIDVVSVEDGSSATIVEGYQQPTYVPSGHLIAGNPEGQIVALPFDPDALEITGEPVVIATGVHRSSYGAQQFAAGGDGAVHWVPEVDASRPDQLFWVDRDGRAEPASSHRRHFEAPRLASGDLVLVGVRSSHDDINVWLLDITRDTLRPLTFGTGYAQLPLWTTDGLGFIYTVPLGNQELPAGIYLRPLEGQAPPRELVTGPLRIPTSISADGSTLLYHTIGAATGWDLWRVPTAPGGEPEPLFAAPFDQLDARFASDPQWIALEADASGRSEIYVRQVGGAGIEGQVSPHGGVSPVWNPRGGELLYIGGGSMMSVPVTLGEEPSAEPARALFDVSGFAPAFDVAADGDRFLMIRLGDEPTGRRINLTLDWSADDTAAARPDGGG